MGGDAGRVIVGVASPSIVVVRPSASSLDFRLVSIGRMIWSVRGGLAANSCAFSLGGGRNGEPGDGNGDVEL